MKSFGTGRRLLGRFGTGHGTLEVVRDGSGDPRKGPGGVEGASGRSGRGQGASGRSGRGRETLGEVRHGLGDPRGGSGLV